MNLRTQAYLGWLIVQPVAKERRVTLGEWLENLGLIDDEKKNGKKRAEDLESMKKKSLEIARKIVEMDKKRRS